MVYLKLWDAERVRAVLTTESRQKTRELFLQTHQPFRRIRLDFCKESGAVGGFITEDDLRAIVQAGPLNAHNRLFLISGEAGSGKSELCQWLEYTTDHDLRMPIHIPRSMTSAAHVAALLREKIGGDIVRPALQRVPLETQAEYIALSAVILLYEQSSPVLTPLDRYADLLASLPLKRAIAAHLRAAAEGVWAHALLGDTAEVAELCSEHALNIPPEQLQVVTRALRHLLGRALEQTLWLGDVRALLASLSECAVARGRRPLLLLEDVTAFQLLGDRLLDHLLDLTSGHFDAVIGVTTGYERTRLTSATQMGDLTHVHHRLQGRCVLTDEQGRAYGFEDDLIAFTRGYLRAVRGVAPTQVPFGDDLYPFTETALRRALAALHEEGSPRQTPRLFLEHVLGTALLASDIPPVIFDQSPYLLRPPTHFRRDSVGDARLQSLLRWYGEIGDRSIVLDHTIAEAMGVPVPPHLLIDGQVQAQRAYVPQLPEQAAISPDWQLELRELQAWLSNGGIYPSRETLKRGIERALLSLGDPRALGSPHSLSLAKAEIVYARGDERLPIVLGRESGDQPSTEAYIKVQVQGTPEECGTLEELAYLELSGAGFSQVCQNIALTLDWAQRHWDTYHDEVRALLARRLGGVGPEELIWTAWRLVCALDGYLWDTRPPTQRRAEESPSYEQRSLWSPQHHAAIYVAGEALLQSHEVIRRLFIGMFTLRDTLLDRSRVQMMARADQGDAAIHRIAHIPLKLLQTLPFKIRPTGQNLYALLAPLQRYASALAQLDIRGTLVRDLEVLHRLEAHLAGQAGLDVQVLQGQLAELRGRCGDVGVTWKERWDEPISALAALTSDDLAGLLARTQGLRGRAEQQTGACDIWGYQALRSVLQPVLRHPYWAARATLQEIRQALLQKARGRYRRDGRTLMGTRSYRALLQTARSLWQEIQDEDSVSQR